MEMLFLSAVLSARAWRWFAFRSRGGIHVGLLPPGRSFARSPCPRTFPAQRGPRDVRPSRPSSTEFPHGPSGDRGAFRGDVEHPQGSFLVSSLGFLPGQGFWLPRPPARSAPGSRISCWTSAKTPDRRSRCWSCDLHPLPGSGKVPGASVRVSARAVARPASRAPGFSDFMAFSRLGHACEDCRHFARRVGPLRHGPRGRRRTALHRFRREPGFGRGNILTGVLGSVYCTSAGFTLGLVA